MTVASYKVLGEGKFDFQQRWVNAFDVRLIGSLEICFISLEEFSRNFLREINR